jgi:hypothetical protein
VVTALLAEGLIEVHVGVGTVLAQLPPANAAERTRLLKGEVEQLVVEAKRLGVELEEVQRAVARHWDRLSDSRAGGHTSGQKEVVSTDDSDSLSGSVKEFSRRSSR